jgi:hypothetical protein
VLEFLGRHTFVARNYIVFEVDERAAKHRLGPDHQIQILGLPHCFERQIEIMLKDRLGMIWISFDLRLN